MLDKKIIIPFVVLLSLLVVSIGLGTGYGAQEPSDPVLVAGGGIEVVQDSDSAGSMAEGVAAAASTGQDVSVQENETTAKEAVKSQVPAKSSGSEVSRGGGGTRRILTMTATGYDGCYECNKPFYGKPSYTGLPLRKGIAAVDPRVIPMGSRIYVEGYGEAIAADQGNAIKGNRIDLFFDSHKQALNYGRKTVKVTIL